MGIRVEGVVSTQRMLARLDSTAKKRVVAELYKLARETMMLARQMAPLDKGFLEKAIKMHPEKMGRQRDGLGRFTRTEVEVYIDLSMAIPGRPGKTIGDYAYEIHEHLSPYGSWKPGKGTQAKQAANSGVVVGGGFLERAAEEIDRVVEVRLRRLLDELDI